MPRRILPHAPRAAFSSTVLNIGEVVVAEGDLDVFFGNGVTPGGVSVLETAISASGAGLVRYASVAEMNADTSRPAGTLAYVYSNNGSATDAANGVYQYTTSWVPAPWYFNAVAAVVQPLVDAAQTSAEVAQAATTNLASAINPVSQATALARSDLFGLPRVNDDFSSHTFGGLTFAALGSALGARVDGFETWLSTSAAAVALTVDLYSRSATGAVDDGGGHSGDVLIASERLQICDLVANFARDGTINRVPVTFLRSFVPDATKLYLIVVKMLDASGAPVGFGASRATGPLPGDPGYPWVKGYRLDAPGDTVWHGMSDGVAIAVRWQHLERSSAIDVTARINAMSNGARQLSVGSPVGLLSASHGYASAGTWYAEHPIAQAGAISQFHFTAQRAGLVTFLFARQQSDQTFTPVARLSLQVSAGENTFSAGTDFDPFLVDQGLFFGIEQNDDLVAYSAIGNSWFINTSAVMSYYQGVTIAASAVINATPFSATTQDRNQQRVVLWSEKLGSVPPKGWDQASGILYTADGMKLASTSGANDWNTAIYSHRWVAVDQRVTRVFFRWTTAGSIIGFGSGQAPGDIVDAGIFRSIIAVNGVNNQIELYYQDFQSNPNNKAAGVVLPSALTIGHDYMLQIGMNWGQHTAQLTDLTSGTVSDVLADGSATAVSDYPRGLQSPYFTTFFRLGNVLLQRVDMLYDGPPPKLVVKGDSISKSVLVAEADGYVGLLRADGITVMRSAIPGASSDGIRRAAENEIVAARAPWVVLAAGANDVLQGKPVADYKYQLALMVEMARRAGSRIIIPVLHPLPGVDVTPYRAAVMSLASAASDIILWRWDIALTVGGNGSSINTALMYSDLVHPIEPGHIALRNRLRVDAPGLWD